jgi:oligopeptide/dipeptide ABC transporter ATP-binding protein
MTAPVLEISGLCKRFRAAGGGVVHAVEDVDLRIGPGEIVGLVGESGSGKSTVGKCVVRLLEPDDGRITLVGKDITHLSQRRLRPVRGDVHMVFQDPYTSLNPRATIRAIVAEPLRRKDKLSRAVARQRAAELIERMGLPSTLIDRYPHELSGGQRQRVGIARSLGLRPKLLIADEPISALDTSVQASILNQLKELQRELGFSCLFIAHNLATVGFLCDRVAVMYLGRIAEQGSCARIFHDPRHPYTRSLLSAALIADPVAQRRRTKIVLRGEIPSPISPPTGCVFRTRCPVVEDVCATTPPLVDTEDGGTVRCHFPGRVPAEAKQPIER